MFSVLRRIIPLFLLAAESHLIHGGLSPVLWFGFIRKSNYEILFTDF